MDLQSLVSILRDESSRGKSDIYKRYLEYQQKYDEASHEYNEKRLAALEGDDPIAVHDWAVNGINY